jgi:hypothetical protein
MGSKWGCSLEGAPKAGRTGSGAYPRPCALLFLFLSSEPFLPPGWPQATHAWTWRLDRTTQLRTLAQVASFLGQVGSRGPAHHVGSRTVSEKIPQLCKNAQICNITPKAMPLLGYSVSCVEKAHPCHQAECLQHPHMYTSLRGSSSSWGLMEATKESRHHPPSSQ